MATTQRYQVCGCCNGKMPHRDVWEENRDVADDCTGNVDADTGRCQAWARSELWETAGDDTEGEEYIR